MLRGLGSVTVGLPFLEEMHLSNAAAAEEAAVPVRAFNIFLGSAFLRLFSRKGLLECLSRSSRSATSFL